MCSRHSSHEALPQHDKEDQVSRKPDELSNHRGLNLLKLTLRNPWLEAHIGGEQVLQSSHKGSSFVCHVCTRIQNSLFYLFQTGSTSFELLLTAADVEKNSVERFLSTDEMREHLKTSRTKFGQITSHQQFSSLFLSFPKWVRLFEKCSVPSVSTVRTFGFQFDQQRAFKSVCWHFISQLFLSQTRLKHVLTSEHFTRSQ